MGLFLRTESDGDETTETFYLLEINRITQLDYSDPKLVSLMATNRRRLMALYYIRRLSYLSSRFKILMQINYAEKTNFANAPNRLPIPDAYPKSTAVNSNKNPSDERLQRMPPLIVINSLQTGTAKILIKPFPKIPPKSNYVTPHWSSPNTPDRFPYVTFNPNLNVNSWRNSSQLHTHTYIHTHVKLSFRR